ncbi:MAG: O-acetyl-ADP-ribose deacetylase [Polyangiaceae bacterium]|nr:O-acetyl-ADP-ribose deacetylase [Polyangiaceae bacterium]
MKVQVNDTVVALVEGDITDQDTDAVVNAAHPDLLGGQGVDGAIHTKGGPEILAECRRIRGCPVGGAVITGAGRLRARFVIHAVGPVYDPQRRDNASLLASAYRNSLRIAAAYGLESIAFPAISTGAFCFPMDEGARIALETSLGFLEREEHGLNLVRFVLYPRENPRAYALFAAALRAVLDERRSG